MKYGTEKLLKFLLIKFLINKKRNVNKMTKALPALQFCNSNIFHIILNTEGTEERKEPRLFKSFFLFSQSSL